MAYIITADRASDILDFLREPRFDRHVIDYRRARLAAHLEGCYVEANKAVAACAAEIIARHKAHIAACQSRQLQAAE